MSSRSRGWYPAGSTFVKQDDRVQDTPGHRLLPFGRLVGPL
jgi:hypothetical protein